MAEQQEATPPIMASKDSVRLSRISKFTEEDLDLLTPFVPPQLESLLQLKIQTTDTPKPKPKPKKWKAAKSKLKTITLSCWTFLAVSLFFFGMAFCGVVVFAASLF
jgi:hypothetical protein